MATKKRPKAKPEAPKKTNVIFRSFRPEVSEFPVMKIRSQQSTEHKGFIEWHVPADFADEFAKDFHCQRHRIVRTDD